MVSILYFYLIITQKFNNSFKWLYLNDFLFRLVFNHKMRFRFATALKNTLKLILDRL